MNTYTGWPHATTHSPEEMAEAGFYYVGKFFGLILTSESSQPLFRLVGYMGTWGGTGPGPFCFTSTEARWLIRDGDREGGGSGRKSDGSIADTARKRSERPWTAARTMEVLRRCPLAIAQRLVHCAIAVSTAVQGRVTRTMSVAQLLRNNSKRKKSNFRSPAPPPYS